MKEMRARLKAEAAGVEPLSEEEIKGLLTPTREHLEKLRRLASGVAGRHSATVMQALKIMLEHTVPPAKKEEVGGGQVQVVVQTLPAKVERFQAPSEATMTVKPEEPN
jgi:hypothetical protein